MTKLTLVTVAVIAAAASATVQVPEHGIDPVVTGPRTVSSEELAQWQARHDRYLECGLCGEGQEYPGD